MALQQRPEQQNTPAGCSAMQTVNECSVEEQRPLTSQQSACTATRHSHSSFRMPAGWRAQKGTHSRELCKLQRRVSQERLQPRGVEQHVTLLTLRHAPSRAKLMPRVGSGSSGGTSSQGAATCSENRKTNRVFGLGWRQQQ